MSTESRLHNLFPSAAELPEPYRLGAPIKQREYLVDGALRRWEGPLAAVRSPIHLKTDKGDEQVVLGSTPLLDADAALTALDAAVKAYDNGQGLWPTMPVAERIQHVETFLARMREQREAVVKLLMWEIGKNLKDSEKEFDRTCDYIVDTIHELKELDRRSSRFELEQGTLGQIRRVPLGVALCMGPYNYPLNETFTTLIPALIMGNTVVFKPAKFGVLLIRPLLEAFRDSFPAGVINVIYGRGRETVSALMETGKIDVFAFIGTNKGASDLKKLHPRPHRLRAALGLDAKNPGIVLPEPADRPVPALAVLTAPLARPVMPRRLAIRARSVRSAQRQAFFQKLAGVGFPPPADGMHGEVDPGHQTVATLCTLMKPLDGLICSMKCVASSRPGVAPRFCHRPL
ncbi:hypothetical protein GCM10027398_19220 [Azotobacter salinestris]